jgi:uncharacterized protein YeaO (DUF488 family)
MVVASERLIFKSLFFRIFMLYTKCIFNYPMPQDGYRISVMSRHTLNDGKTLDSRITSDYFDLWAKELAPLSKFVGAWYKNKISWEDFQNEYFKHIRQPSNSEIIGILARRALNQDITLLCSEEKPEQCHRKLLAGEFQIYQPNLKIIYR